LRGSLSNYRMERLLSPAAPQTCRLLNHNHRSIPMQQAAQTQANARTWIIAIFADSGRSNSCLHWSNAPVTTEVGTPWFFKMKKPEEEQAAPRVAAASASGSARSTTGIGVAACGLGWWLCERDGLVGGRAAGAAMQRHAHRCFRAPSPSLDAVWRACDRINLVLLEERTYERGRWWGWTEEQGHPQRSGAVLRSRSA